MSLSKEHSQDKAEWVKWPHLETHWQPQHYETPHRAVKKGGNTRSHSWWWDSHISPKSSKWLQENLAEMDSKVNAMLKIIEEDADSFAKRAEMYYKRRPELVNLVEEFYRTYRALVERHTFLTKELRQNIAPALQAQLGASYSTPPNPPSDLLGRPGSDGFDIASLSSYTFPGALEFDEDNQIDVSGMKANEDEEDAPSASSTVSFVAREFELKPSSSSSEEESPSPHHKHRELRMPLDAASSIQLKKRIEKLEDEKNALMIKSGEDNAKITDLQSEVSNLLMKAKVLEAEEKLAKERLNSLLKLKLSLEAENLKLNHGLIACKEEKTRLFEERDHGVQEMLATGERVRQLEQEVSLLQHKIAASRAETLSGHEQAQKFQDECEKLQKALIATEDENQRDVVALQEAYESRVKEFKRQALDLEKENGEYKKQIAVQTLKVQELEQQATEVTHIQRQLEQDLVKSKESKDALELALLFRIPELQKELEAAESSKQHLLEQVVLRDGRVSVLEETVRDVQEHKAKLETDMDGLGMQMLGLEAKYQELQKERNSYIAYSQRLDSQCKASEAASAQLKEELASLLKESTSLREEKIASESLLAKAMLEMEELRLCLSGFSSDRSLLVQRASGNLNTFQIGDDRSVEESGLQTTHLRDLEFILSRLVLEKNMLERRQAEAQHLLSEAEKASEAARVKARKTADEHMACVAELDSRLATLLIEKDLLEKQGREVSEVYSMLKVEFSLLEKKRVEASKHVEHLLSEVEELKKARDHALAKCQNFEVELSALKQEEERVKAQLEVKLVEGVFLQNDKAVLEADLAQVRLEMKELHSGVLALSSEKASLKLELLEALEQVRITKIINSELHAKTEEYQAERKKTEDDLRSQSTQLEEMVSSLLQEKKALESNLAETQKVLHCLEEEKHKLLEEIKQGQALADDVNGRMVNLESENKQLSHDLEQAGQQVVRLQEIFAGLSMKYTTQSAGLAKLEEQVTLLNVEKDNNCKVLASFESEVNGLQMKVSDLLVEKTASSEQVLQMTEGMRSLEAKLANVLRQKESLSEKLATSSNHVMLLQMQLDAHQVDLQHRAERIQALEMDVEGVHLLITRADEREKALICEQQRSLDEIACLQRRIQELEVQASHSEEDKVLVGKDFEEQKEKLQMQLQNSINVSWNLEAELLKLHQAVSSAEESNSTPIHAQSRGLDADLLLPGRFEHIHHKVGTLLEERRQLVKEAGSQRVENDEMASKVRCLEKDKDAVHRELLRALEEREQMVISLSAEATKGKHLEEELKRTQQALDHSIEDKVTVTGQLKTATEEGESLRNDLKALQDELKKNQVVVLEARRDYEKLVGELSQLKQVNAITENELNIKLSEVSSAHEHASKLLLSKGVLEEEAQQHLHQIKTINEEVERLQDQLQDAQQKIGGLEDELSKQFLDGKNAACEAEKEISKQIATVDSLKQEMAAMHIRISDLDQDVSSVLDERKVLYDEAEALRLELKGAQGEREGLMLHMRDRESHLEDRELENRRLEEQLHAADRASVQAKKEIDEHIAHRDSLNLDIAEMLAKLRRLEGDLSCVKGEKETLTSSLQGMQLELTGVQGENEHLKAQLKEASLELEGKETETRNIQEQLKATESHSSLLAEALSSAKSSLGAQVDWLQEELVQLKATNIQIQKDLAMQLECVSKLKNELSGLRGATSVLQEERDLGNKELADVRREAAGHLNNFEAARKRECDKDAELLELSALAESLKLSLLAKDLENSNLLEELRKSADCQSAAEKKYLDEVSFLQSEKLKWQTEVSANSDLMAEKVNSLRMENAALHQDLSFKLELVLKQQQEIGSLTEEYKNLSQALQNMSAEMQEVRNDLQIYKEIVIPSMEERAVELQDENRCLAASKERHVAEIVRLRAKLEEAKGELVLLHEKNSILTMELIFNVEMLKHVDVVVIKTAKAQSERLCDKLGSQEKHCHMLEQMLTRATEENGLVSQKLSSVTQEKNSLVAEVHHLFATLAEVEQLRTELASARKGTCLVRESEPAEGVSLANLDSFSKSHTGNVEIEEPIQFGEQISEPTQNIRGGSQDAEASSHEEIAPSLETQKQKCGSLLTLQHSLGVVESDSSRPGKVVSVYSSPVVTEQLKEEIAFLQEKIQKLELEGIAQVTIDLPPSAHEYLLISARKNSTASSSSILTVEDTQDRLIDLQKLKEENQNLIEEIESLKGQSLAAWMEHNLIENTVRDLQASKALLQETNEHINSELHSCKEGIVRLEDKLNLLQQKHAALLQEVEVLTQEKESSDKTSRMLKGVIGTLELSNRHLQVENELAGEELKQLQGSLANLQEEGTELVARMKVRLVSTLEEVKLVIDECRRKMGEEGFSEVMMDNGQSCSVEQVYDRISLLESKQGMVTESFNEEGTQETMPGLVPKNRFFLTELQARAEEANVLLEFLMCIRKLLLTFLSSSKHTCQRDTLFMNVASMKEEASILVETRSPQKDLDLVGSAHHHIKLAERLHQAFVDEKLEHELIELKEGRKQLKEDLTVRLDEVQRMELELENLEMRLKEEKSGKREGVASPEENRSKKKRLEEHVKELREMLAQQRGQICKMKEEVMFGEEQQEATAEDQVTVLVSMESAPNMDGWDDEQVSVLSKELESLRSLNRRHSAELRTISQDLQSMGSIIKSAQDHLLLEEPSEDVEEEIISIADLRIQKSNIIDLRGQNSRVSVDSIQELLSPSPHMVEGDSISARRMSSDGSVGQFALKPRNFGFTWFMLLFGSDRKASSLVRGKSDKAVWAALRRSRRSSSGSAAVVVERSRRKAAGCLACVSNTNRLDSFEHR